MNKIVEINGLVKSFDDLIVLKNINLYIAQNEFVTLLGPSGCGKTTLLRLIGGFESQDSGTITFDGKQLKDLPPHQREINTVFQNYALFPHLNVFDNIIPFKVVSKYLFVKRPKTGLLANQWEFPSIIIDSNNTDNKFS